MHNKKKSSVWEYEKASSYNEKKWILRRTVIMEQMNFSIEASESAIKEFADYLY